MATGEHNTLPPAAHAFQRRPAGLITRLGAALVDCVVVAVAVAVIYAAVLGVRFVVSPSTFHAPQNLAALVVPVSLGVAVAYLTQSWCGTGRTYGCALLGLRVVGRNGHHLSLSRAFVRALLCTAFPAGLLWAALSSTNRSVQDIIVGTSVIYDWTPRGVGF